MLISKLLGGKEEYTKENGPSPSQKGKIIGKVCKSIHEHVFFDDLKLIIPMTVCKSIHEHVFFNDLKLTIPMTGGGAPYLKQGKRRANIYSRKVIRNLI